MSAALSAVLAVALVAAPVEEPPGPRVKLIGALGVGLMAVGGALEIIGQQQLGHADVQSINEAIDTRYTARSNLVGGAALLGFGCCLLALSALLTTWHLPSIMLSASPRGAQLGFSGTLP